MVTALYPTSHTTIAMTSADLTGTSMLMRGRHPRPVNPRPRLQPVRYHLSSLRPLKSAPLLSMSTSTLPHQQFPLRRHLFLLLLLPLLLWILTRN